MSRNKTAFEKHTLSLVETLAETALTWGYAEDSSDEEGAKQAEAAYNEAKAALLKRIHHLHAKRRKLDRLSKDQ